MVVQHRATGLLILLGLGSALTRTSDQLNEPQLLNAAYAQRSLESVAQTGGVDALTVAKLRADIARVSSLMDDVEKAQVLTHALDAIRRLGAASRPAASRSEGGVLTFEDVAPADPGLWLSFVSWALDRPVPWERDCSCCYPVCPSDRFCIKQADKRYLACAGYSVRQHLKVALLDRCVDARERPL